jgi:transcriptional regulator GlxA family with amidase domain
MRTKPDARPTMAHPRRIVLVAIPPTMELDVTGPLAVFDAANRMRTRQDREAPYRVEVASGGRSLSVVGESGLALVAARHASAIRGPVDTVLVAGGRTGSSSAMDRSRPRPA